MGLKVTFHFIFISFSAFLCMSFTCEPKLPEILPEFSNLENYDPAFKKCLEETKNRCLQSGSDENKKKFEDVLGNAFAEIKKSSEFREYYCQNFENGKPKFNFERECDALEVSRALEGASSCDELIKKPDEHIEVSNLCSELVIQELKKPKYLTEKIKTNFKSKLKNVISGYQEIFSDNKAIQEVLEKISLETDFDYRLTTFVAGARTNSDLPICAFEWDRLSFCEKEFVIVPGGKVFSRPENLELILAHEVGHIINRVKLPEKEFDKFTSTLKSCNHLGSSELVEDDLRSEASADIYMQKYFKKFMKQGPPLDTHFCDYEPHKSYQKTSYLHPFHRQAMLNCNPI